MIFSLWIETDAGSYQYGYHLGTVEWIARDCACEIFRYRRPELGSHINSVSLRRGGEIFDTFDGKWVSA